jgi:hypothetical protein
MSKGRIFTWWRTWLFSLFVGRWRIVSLSRCCEGNSRISSLSRDIISTNKTLEKCDFDYLWHTLVSAGNLDQREVYCTSWKHFLQNVLTHKKDKGNIFLVSVNKNSSIFRINYAWYCWMFIFYQIPLSGTSLILSLP